MRKYYLIFWDFDNESLIEIFATDIQNLYNNLVQQFPNLDEILLNKFNYNYISNSSHWFSAGYISSMASQTLNDISISKALSPAHFNKSFFYILGYQEYESIQEIRKNKLDKIDENSE